MCFNCGHKREILPDCIIPSGEFPPGIHPHVCPHCLAEMNPRTWDKLAAAFWELEEVNRELRTDSEGYTPRRPLFQAEFKAHYVPGKNIKAE